MYHPVLSRARGSSRAVSQVWLGLLLQYLLRIPGRSCLASRKRSHDTRDRRSRPRACIGMGSGRPIATSLRPRVSAGFA